MGNICRSGITVIDEKHLYNKLDVTNPNFFAEIVKIQDKEVNIELDYQYKYELTPVEKEPKVTSVLLTIKKRSNDQNNDKT